MKINFRKPALYSLALLLKANEIVGQYLNFSTAMPDFNSSSTGEFLNSSTAMNNFNFSSTGEHNFTGNATSSTGTAEALIAPNLPKEAAFALAGVIVVCGLGLAIRDCVSRPPKISFFSKPTEDVPAVERKEERADAAVAISIKENSSQTSCCLFSSCKGQQKEGLSSAIRSGTTAGYGGGVEHIALDNRPTRNT